MDKSFHDLLDRYVKGNCTPEEIRRIGEWYARIEDTGLDLGAVEKLETKERILGSLRRELPLAAGSGRRRFLEGNRLLKLAAAVALVVASTFWIVLQQHQLQDAATRELSEASAERVIENNTLELQELELPDGSTVRLEPSAKIFFDREFTGSRRNVYLSGKAFFHIVKDPARPFYVFSESIATRVLGTSFIVDAPPGAKKVEVKVMTGKVSVFQVTPKDRSERRGGAGVKNSAANGVVLSPNQKVEYFIEEGHWVTGLVEDPHPVKPIDPKVQSFVFTSAPLKAVLEAINDRFSIEVITENEKIYNCTFTGDVSALSLYDMLDIVSTSIGSTYEVKGTRILLSGKGCY